MRTTLTIAGSDSSGGAGIQADLKTFAAFGVYGLSAVTAVTAQSTAGITASAPLPADLVIAQIEAVAGDIAIHATKTGMLATAAIVEAVVATIEELDLPLVVAGPVALSSSGQQLLDADGVLALVSVLLPRVRLVTPNLPEAELISGCRVESLPMSPGWRSRSRCSALEPAGMRRRTPTWTSRSTSGRSASTRRSATP